MLAQGSRLKGASAIIEKDYASGKLAEMTDADVLLILTGVDAICLNYGTPQQTPLRRLSVEEARRYAAQGQFAEETVLPKVIAGLEFVDKKKGRKAVITSPSLAREALAGEAGTTIE